MVLADSFYLVLVFCTIYSYFQQYFQI